MCLTSESKKTVVLKKKKLMSDQFTSNRSDGVPDRALLSVAIPAQAMAPICVYLLVDGTCPRRWSYIGYTTNLQRRLRQHRKELVGGAKYTARFRDARYMAYISGFPTKRSAMRYEWWAKRRQGRLHIHRTMCHLKGHRARVNCFFAVLAAPPFRTLSLTINLQPNYFQAPTEQALTSWYSTEVAFLPSYPSPPGG
jgi:predicted GIY-YIG superfamily endonuclease